MRGMVKTKTLGTQHLLRSHFELARAPFDASHKRAVLPESAARPEQVPLSNNATGKKRRSRFEALVLFKESVQCTTSQISRKKQRTMQQFIMIMNQTNADAQRSCEEMHTNKPGAHKSWNLRWNSVVPQRFLTASQTS